MVAALSSPFPPARRPKPVIWVKCRANFGRVVMLLEQFYRDQSDLTETIEALNAHFRRSPTIVKT
jgi:hypothetical protein